MNDLIQRIPLDKLLHFLVGSTLAAWLLPINVPLAGFAVVIAALGKELYDWRDYGKFDWFDALTTIGGGAASFAVYILTAILL